jgi:hypothetical protein
MIFLAEFHQFFNTKIIKFVSITNGRQVGVYPKMNVN